MKINEKIICPECQAEISVSNTMELGEVITCPDCSSNLEIVKKDPIIVNQATEVKEDWGE